MKLTKKQLGLGTLAAVTAIAVPVATVVSCGDKKDSQTTDGTIDMTTMASPQALIEKIGKDLNIIPSKPISEIAIMDKTGTDATNANYLTKTGFENLKKLIEGFNFNNEVKMSFNGKSFSYDFKPLTKIQDEIKVELKKPFDPAAAVDSTTTANRKYGFMELLPHLKDPSSTSPYYVADIAEVAAAEYSGPTKLNKVAFDKYDKLLGMYHDFAYKFVTSDLYKEWIKTKEFKIAEPAKGFKDAKNFKLVKPGERFDARPVVDSAYATGAYKYKTESSNFEAQFITNVMGLQK